MHDNARTFIAAAAGLFHRPFSMLEVGSRVINGLVSDLFPLADPYIGIDLVAGPGVDVVVDGSVYVPEPVGMLFDVVLCAETLEHATDPYALCRNMVNVCRPGGFIIVTAAGPGRQPHSAIDGGDLRPGEHYRNVTVEDLRSWFVECGCMIQSHVPGDIYALIQV